MRNTSCVKLAALHVLAALLATATSACGPALVMHAPDARIVPARVAAIPAYVESFVVGASERVTELDDERRETTKSLDASLNAYLWRQGGRFYAGPSLADIDEMAELSLWGRRTLNEIRRQLDGSMPLRHHRVDEYFFDGDTTDIQDSLDADFLLLSLFLDGRNTAGRKVRNFFTPPGGTAHSARREALACVVRLVDGRIIACSFATPPSRLDDGKTAQTFVNSLLASLLPH